MNFPCYENGQRITAATTSAATALAGTAMRVMSARDVLVYNPGPYIVYIKAGDAGAVADDTCAPVPPLALWAYGKGPNTHVALVAPDGDQDVLVIVGEGA